MRNLYKLQDPEFALLIEKIVKTNDQICLVTR